MDWIERWWGVSPDGGDGSLEMVFVSIAAAVVVASVPLFSRRVRSLCLRLAEAIALRLQRKL